MLAVTTPAGDPKLLSAAEMRLAVGLASDDSSKDTVLETLNSRVSRAIASHCKVATAGIAVPTLRSETLTETFRTGMSRQRLLLSRRPIVSVTSVVEDGVTLTGADYEIDASTGILLRLESDEPADWAWGKITVVYVAGWATVPDDLKLAASKLASEIYTVGTRDPNLKRIKVEGVDEREFWVAPSSDPLISSEVDALLAPYMNVWLG
jgi:hypothetical protein